MKIHGPTDLSENPDYWVYELGQILRSLSNVIDQIKL